MKKLTDEELLAVWWKEIQSAQEILAGLAKSCHNGTADHDTRGSYNYWTGYVSALLLCIEDLERRSVSDFRKPKDPP